MYFKGTVRESDRHTAGELPSTGSLPNWLEWPRLRQADGQSLDLQPGIPCVAPSMLGPQAAFPGVLAAS